MRKKYSIFLLLALQKNCLNLTKICRLTKIKLNLRKAPEIFLQVVMQSYFNLLKPRFYLENSSLPVAQDSSQIFYAASLATKEHQ